MSQFYVHVQLVVASSRQANKFEELMRSSKYRKTTKDLDDDCQLPSGGYILNSVMESRHVVYQTYLIADSAGVKANIFACEFEHSACLLPSPA